MKYFNESFIKQCKNSDRLAQKQLFEELYAPMYRVCYRYIDNQTEAEDCLMRGFMKTFQNIQQFKYEGEHSFFSWIRKIMVNEALMFLRQKHYLMFSIDHTEINVSIQSDIIQKMNAEELNSLILLLPTGYRTVFNLYVVEGYDHKEISVMLGITESTSRTQLAKAKSKLQQMIKKTEVSYGNGG